MLTDAELLRDLGYWIPALGYLGHCVTFELIAEIGLPHHRLLSSKLGSKASRNLGATQPPGSPVPASASLIVIPGTKATIADLGFLRAQGRSGRAVARIMPVLSIRHWMDWRRNWPEQQTLIACLKSQRRQHECGKIHI
jgi:hypothetical protein